MSDKDEHGMYRNKPDEPKVEFTRGELEVLREKILAQTKKGMVFHLNFDPSRGGYYSEYCGSQPYEVEGKLQRYRITTCIEPVGPVKLVKENKDELVT